MNSSRASLASRVARLALTALALFASAGGAPDSGPSASSPIGEAFALVFDAESIRVEIVGDSLEVRGTYVLLCRSPVEESIPLFYPFPSDSLLGGARMISLAFRGDAGSPASGRWEVLPNAPGVRWWLPPCPGDSLIAEAVYRQEIKAEYARYIVTTARIWGRPLRRAVFEIRLPPGVEPLYFSFPFERRSGPDGIYYSYEERGFFPDRDIVVRWKR